MSAAGGMYLVVGGPHHWRSTFGEGSQLTPLP
jgi:hypothetical protein